MIFNNIDFKDLVIVEQVRKPLLPSISNTFKDIPGTRGSRFIKNKLEVKNIEVDIRLIETNKYNWEDKVRLLASNLYTEEPKKIYFKDTDKYNYVVLDGNVDFEKMLYTGFTTLSFIAPDPIDFGQKKTLNITTNPVVYNTATYPTKGKITVDVISNISFIEVTLQNTGEFVYIKDSFIAGDKVIIDFEEEEVYKNDYSIMNKLYLESDFFEIPVGEFRITTNTGNVILEYVERWL